ncbi:iron ABC transporter permease [Paenibacillus glucanolyticus]|jgi:iron complex transport system permease protein|uniref:FecCD family ABC transporter permease n=1 Tax=Paenibacillus TaxID=44249 RepID=UPI0003E24827|nr:MULTISPECIES: iron ABC transporter permease [Paenibacillus]ANA78984.1 iron ABC transporter permease [Paenibacillus glucanolyticus]AVV57098.1 iron ABC transporter permease [Paenibacillus glucanolyticus]AWP26240.1 iron ABC transporter permease [Paenibacillus sp. Cedars]ETT32215.1 transport system permease [Paenibacillus sp. FSL R5-808]MPY16578.1 iron ABC transporter permease [Paenibacillus glucanolyticus]
MTNKTRKVMSVSMILLLAIITVFLISLNMGTLKIPLAEVIKAFNGTGSEQNYTVLVHFRLPRMVIAILIGAGIAVSGAILQSVSRNALADPGILGINSGAGLAVVLYIFYFQGSSFSSGVLSVYIMPFAALLGAFLATFLIYTLAWKQGVTPIRLVLVGIGINAAFAALIIVFQLMMDPNNFMQATIWLSGSIWGASWEYVYAILPWILLLIPLALYKSQNLNVLNLGDHTATGLGVKVERERRTLLFISVALAGACVAVGGGIAFLGLVAPHLARKWVGPRHQGMLPVSALIGALVLLVADMIGKNLMAPSEIPVGLVVSCLGAPYFIYLLIKD